MSKEQASGAVTNSVAPKAKAKVLLQKITNIIHGKAETPTPPGSQNSDPACGLRFHHMEEDAVAKKYTFGRQVVVSSHRGQTVRFATRNADKEQVIVKQRNTQISFHKSSRQLTSWRGMMERLGNLPPSPYMVGILDLIDDPSTHSVVMEHVYGTDLFEIFSEAKFADLNLRAVLDFIKSGAGRTPDPILLRDPLHMQVSRMLDDLCDKDSEGSGRTSESTACSEGEGCTSLLQREKHVFVQAIADNLVRGLAVFEQAGLVHKDVKLENVVFCAETEVFKMIDFDTVADANVVAKDVLGTDQYIAPEAYAGHYSTASDMFSLGVLLYKAMAGSFPFPSWIFDDDRGQNYVAHPKMKAIHWRLMYHEVDFSAIADKDLRDFIEGCMAKDHTQRLTTEEALRHKLFSKKF